MSANNQSNGKKSSSGNNSVINTPSSTPVTSSTNITNGQATVQSTPPPPNNNNAPKYGTLVPNRIFVGGISANTTEGELLQLFSNYGTVKAAKIIQDRAGVSKGYGFITFESEDDAKRLQREADNIVLRERKLNIAPAIKKQPFSRAFDASSPPSVAAGNPAQYFFQPGAVPYFQSGVAYYTQPTSAPGDPNTQQAVYQPPPVYPAQSGPPQTAAYPPVVFPAQPIYMPQQYPMPLPYEYNYYPASGGPQYMVGGQTGPQPQGPPMQPPGSPPRPPCYSQQLPYNPDAMFYNLPIYNAVDGGPAMYSDSLEITNSGYTEESYTMVDGVLPQEIIPTAPPLDTEHGSTVTETNLVPHSTQHTQADNSNRRQSDTPVVSLLSLDQHQEKDFTAMQSGRRRKSVPPPPPTNQTTQHIHPNNSNNNGFVPYADSYHHTAAAPPQSMFTYMNNVCNAPVPFVPPDVSYMQKYVSKNHMVNGNEKNTNWAVKKRRHVGIGATTDRRNNDSSSSLRSDSNSSASVVDENRNEEKSGQNAFSSPPPAPYSPITHYTGSKCFSNKNFQGANRGIGRTNIRCSYNNNNNGGTSGKRYMNGPQTYQQNSGVNNNNNKKWNSCIKNSDSNIETINKVTTNSFVTNQQMHPAAAAASQHFVPPSRRNRRSIRRNTHAGTPLSEIGAGDAPLPPPEVSDTCKKLDNLKL